MNKQRFFRSFLILICRSHVTLVSPARDRYSQLQEALPSVGVPQLHILRHFWAIFSGTFFGILGQYFEHYQLLNLTRPLGPVVGGVSTRGRSPTAKAAPVQSQSQMKLQVSLFEGCLVHLVKSFKKFHFISVSCSR